MLSKFFHVRVHSQVDQAASGNLPAMFGRTFEEATEALGRLPRMFAEPDGSFVWVASHEPAWQIDGVLYDGAGRLWYVELKGCCPQDAFDQLLLTLGWPQTPVAFQLVQEAVSLDEAGFRQYAGWLIEPTLSNETSAAPRQT
jgi:hypothetical protein